LSDTSREATAFCGVLLPRGRLTKTGTNIPGRSTMGGFRDWQILAPMGGGRHGPVSSGTILASVRRRKWISNQAHERRRSQQPERVMSIRVVQNNVPGWYLNSPAPPVLISRTAGGVKDLLSGLAVTGN